MVNIGGSAWNFRVIEKLFPNSSQFLPFGMEKETKAAPREEGTAFSYCARTLMPSSSITTWKAFISLSSNKRSVISSSINSWMVLLSGRAPKAGW